MFLGELTFPVQDLDGIGPAAARNLAGMGILNIGQFLRHYPLRYEDRITVVPLSQSSAEKPALTTAEVMHHDTFFWKNGTALKVLINDGSDTASMLCYGRNFLASKLPPGKKIRITGPFERNRFGEIQSGSFVFEDYSETEESREFGMILPVYPLGGTLSQAVIRKAMRMALSRYAMNIRNELPQDLQNSLPFTEKSQCLKNMHFPETFTRMEEARASLIFEELFHLQLTVAKRGRLHRHGSSGRWDEELPKRLIESLPFTLTKDQNAALEDIRGDMSRDETMLRLIQGEVGSGKTLVAFIACLGIIGKGRQAAFMAPTELLARQHADNAQRILGPLGIRIAFLTGEVTAASRRSLNEALACGAIDLLVGTHALFSTDITFNNLGIAIIDEQHRFGVQQRRALMSKGSNPDVLALSATPIPRTLALTAFGDMDVSSIKTMPAGRLPIKTHLTRMGNESKVYEFVRREIQQSRRAYFVYPLIEESEKSDLKNAQDMAEKLQGEIYQDFHGALIHSRVDEERKREIMEAFHSGELDYLVATSVVEVGVDVPEASCMVIEHAERFGLSALHQLRGRVGRGKEQSYCFLIYSSMLTEEGKRRLKTMKEISDGFALAEEDLKMRGPGDMAGIRQSGFLQFSIADPVRDLDVLLDAREKARELIDSDAELSRDENRVLRDLFKLCPPFDENLLRTV